MESKPSSAPQGTIHRRFNPWLVGSVGLFLLLAAAGTVYYLWPRIEEYVASDDKPLPPTRTLKSQRDVSFDTLAFYPDGSRLVSGRGCEEIIVWDPATGKEVSTYEHKESLDVADIAHKRAARKRQQRRALEQLATTLAVTPELFPVLPPLCLKAEAIEKARRKDNPQSGLYNTVVWFTSRNAGLFCVTLGPKGPAVKAYSSTDFTWDEKYEDDQARDPGDGKERRVITYSKYTIAHITFNEGGYDSSSTAGTEVGKASIPLGYSPDGHWLLVRHRDGGFRLADISDSTGFFDDESIHLPLPKEKSRFVGLLPNGKQVVMIDESGAPAVWSLETSKETLRLKGSQDTIVCFTLSKDGRKLLTGHQNHAITLWDLETGKEIRHFVGHTGPVRRLALSHDGTQFVSDGADDTLRHWDVEQGRLLRQLEHPKRAATAITIAPDGRKVAVAFGKEIQVWDMPP